MNFDFFYHKKHLLKSQFLKPIIPQGSRHINVPLQRSPGSYSSGTFLKKGQQKSPLSFSDIL